ncbi:MAG: hypothetical protein GF331_24095 [Chitinivibrionales bacterium]|nr:hypothetical protein [Chitinivibrionales bacterium]
MRYTENPIVTGEFETRCGTVEETRDGEAVVMLARGELNPACAKCGACGATPPEGVRIRVRTNGAHIHQGDSVMVRHYIPNAAAVSGIVFGLPLLGLIAGMAGVAACTPQSLDSPLAVAASAGGLALGAISAWLTERTLARKHPPAIVSQSPSVQQSGTPV